MVKSYGDYLDGPNNNNNKFKPKANDKDKEKEEDTSYLDLWKENPSCKDVDSTETVLKAASLVVICLLFFASVLYATYNLGLSIGIAGIVSISFVLAFHNKFFSLRHLFSFRSFDPLEDFVFWRVEKEPDNPILEPKDYKKALFYTNRKDLSTTGVRIFKVLVIPENVRENLNRFFIGLHKLKVAFTYQIVHRQLQTSVNRDGSESSTFETIIYFSTFYNVKGRLTESKLEKMVVELKENAVALESAFASNFHHFKVVELSGKELEKAYRISVLKQDVEIEENVDGISCETVKPKTVPTILRASYILAIVICLDRLLLVFNLSLMLQFVVTFTILAAILVIWWRELFFFAIKSKLFESEEIEVVDPFCDVKFFKVSKAPETIYYQVEGKLIGGIKINNLYFTYPPPYCSASKFYEALIKRKCPLAPRFS